MRTHSLTLAMLAATLGACTHALTPPGAEIPVPDGPLTLEISVPEGAEAFTAGTVVTAQLRPNFDGFASVYVLNDDGTTYTLGENWPVTAGATALLPRGAQLRVTDAGDATKLVALGATTPLPGVEAGRLAHSGAQVLGMRPDRVEARLDAIAGNLPDGVWTRDEMTLRLKREARAGRGPR